MRFLTGGQPRHRSALTDHLTGGLLPQVVIAPGLQTQAEVDRRPAPTGGNRAWLANPSVSFLVVGFVTPVVLVVLVGKHCPRLP